MSGPISAGDGATQTQTSKSFGLVRAEYSALDDLAADECAFAVHRRSCRMRHRTFANALLTILLDVMRRGLAVTAEALDPATVDEIGACVSARLTRALDAWPTGKTSSRLQLS